MAGVLQFTLGIEASKALETLGLSATKIVSLAGAGELARKALDNMWGQVEKGAALNELSKRTGESVQNLFMLQKGFKAAGLSADSVGGAIFMLNKSLGGINEMGEDTASVFAKVGLSAEGLKKAGSAGAIQQVLQKMSGMDQTTATAFAGKIFGRGEAANMVQASRSMKEFNEAMAGAKAQAAVFQRVAAMFDAIEKTLVKVKAKLDPIWLVLAEKIAPVLKDVLDWINNIDLSPLGEALGDTWDVFAEGFKQGRILELLEAAFAAAAEYGGNILTSVLGDAGFWSSIWEVMVGTFKTAFGAILKFFISFKNIGDAIMAGIFDKAFEMAGKIPGLNKVMGMEGHKATSVKDYYEIMGKQDEGTQQWLNSVIGSGAGNIKTGVSGIGDSLARAQAASGGEAQDAFRDLVGNLLGARKAQRKSGQPGEAPGAGEHYDLAGKGEKYQGTVLEKIGFVMGGAVGGPNATTAKNTTRMVQQLGKLVECVSGHSQGTGELNALPA